jgi:hypothetical protein
LIVIFLGGQAIEFGLKGMVEAIGKSSWVAELGCDLVSRTLKSRYVPDYLKAHELGIRWTQRLNREMALQHERDKREQTWRGSGPRLS